MSTTNKFDRLAEKLSAILTVNQSDYLYFGGTAYLGIPQHKAMINLYIAGIERYGLNNGTSRGNNVQLGIYHDAEQYMAEKFGAESALITSSGYLAAKLTVQNQAKQGELHYAPNTHPALWINGNPNHNLSFDTWCQQMVKEINESKIENWILVSNSLNNLYPEIYDFSFIERIHPTKKITLIVDDSHGIGLINSGTGVLNMIPKLAHVEVIVVASMAKALGIDAGVILGSKKQIDRLKETDEFYGASPPAAAGLYAFMHAKEVYEEAFAKLQTNIAILAQKLQGSNDWHFIEHFPVFLCHKPEIERQLMAANILISSFPYPDRNGGILNRIVLSSWHSKADMLKLAGALNL